MPKILENEDVRRLLREDVERLGGQVAWARKNKLDRSSVNRILLGLRPLNNEIIAALKLRIVYIAMNSEP
jgi:hypothetical protein